ncbi:uncharacterized protein LOC143269704 [Peromyscus maniculatus bairdii]|uniref:uncharacterized protein LOC143269704 n=1 Tax=Peromyscus maniculatus bairdii TaxID=230844 RepID=UPI003FD21086
MRPKLDTGSGPYQCRAAPGEAYLLSIPEGFENHQIKLEYLAIWKIEMRSIYLETPSNSADVTQLLNSKDGSLQAGGNSVRQLSPPELVGD